MRITRSVSYDAADGMIDGRLRYWNAVPWAENLVYFDLAFEGASLTDEGLLVASAVPLPPAIALLASGLAGLMLRRKSK